MCYIQVVALHKLYLFAHRFNEVNGLSGFACVDEVYDIDYLSFFSWVRHLAVPLCSWGLWGLYHGIIRFASRGRRLFCGDGFVTIIVLGGLMCYNETEKDVKI